MHRDLFWPVGLPPNIYKRIFSEKVPRFLPELFVENSSPFIVAFPDPNPFVVYCLSFKKDVKRSFRIWHSLQRAFLQNLSSWDGITKDNGAQQILHLTFRSLLLSSKLSLRLGSIGINLPGSLQPGRFLHVLTLSILMIFSGSDFKNLLMYRKRILGQSNHSTSFTRRRCFSPHLFLLKCSSIT